MKSPIRTRPRKIVAGLAAGGIIFGAASGAFAYYLLEGSGTGSANAPIAGASTSPVTVTVQPFTSPLSPGGSEPIMFRVDNPSNNQVQIQQLQVAVTGTSIPACNPTWFAVTPGQTDNPLPVVLSPGAGVGDSTTPWTLNFTNLSTTDQSACESATVTVTVTAS